MQNNTIKNIESFGNDIKVITINLSNKYPDDAFIFRAKEQILLAVDLFPVYVIDTVGYYLYEYRDQIRKMEDNIEHEEFFLDNSYNDDINNSKNSDTKELVKYLIPKLKECAKKMPTQEKNEYKKLVIKLFYTYVDYLIFSNRNH